MREGKTKERGGIDSVWQREGKGGSKTERYGGYYLKTATGSNEGKNCDEDKSWL